MDIVSGAADCRLAGFQDAFAHALLADEAQTDAGSPVAALLSQPGFAVYRNTVRKGCVDALQDNHPAVVRLVGEEWFRAAAVAFARRHPPRDPALVHYGAGFADFLAGFAPAAALPWLSGVALLDRLWIEAHTAVESETLRPEDIARLTPEELARCTLGPHPAARWAWFDEHPAFGIWQRNRDTATHAADEIAWRAEGALLARPRGAVQWCALDAAACAFLDACAAGEALPGAAAAALAADPAADLSAIMARLLVAGAFGKLTVRESIPGEDCS